MKKFKFEGINVREEDMYEGLTQDTKTNLVYNGFRFIRHRLLFGAIIVGAIVKLVIDDDCISVFDHRKSMVVYEQSFDGGSKLLRHKTNTVVFDDELIGELLNVHLNDAELSDELTGNILACIDKIDGIIAKITNKNNFSIEEFKMRNCDFDPDYFMECMGFYFYHSVQYIGLSHRLSICGGLTEIGEIVVNERDIGAYLAFVDWKIRYLITN